MAVPRVYLFGDSQTQFGFGEEGCWCALLAHKLQRKCDVINRGFSGYNSRWCMSMLPAVIRPEEAPDVFAVVIMLGSNDAAPAGNASLQHVPLDEYESYMERMAAYLKGIGIEAANVIVVSAPPVDADKWNTFCMTCNIYDRHGGLSNEELGRYAQASARAAARAGVVHINLFQEMLKAEEWRSFVEVDGLHLSKKGGEFLLGLLWPLLEARALALPSYFPDFEEIRDNAVVPAVAASYLGGTAHACGRAVNDVTRQ